jgi:hypothetical protein
MKKIVLFAGSGLSCSLASIPVQYEFLTSVLNKERNKWVLDILKDKKEKKILEKWNDCEMLLSYLYYQDMVTRKNCNFHPYKHAIINFRMALNEFLFDPKIKKNNEQKKDEEKANNNFKYLIEYINNNKFSIITTNYDLLIEQILKKLKKNYSYCIKEGKKSNNKIKLLKLHGSINLIEKRKKSICTSNLIGEYKNKKLINNIIKNLRDFKDKSKYNKISEKDKKYYLIEKKPYTPVTIPFFFQKFDWYSQRWNIIFKKRIWKEAEAVLADADYIIFIGWGIAQADYPLLALLNKAEWWKKKIVVINRNADKFYKYGLKFHHLSGKYLQDFENDEFKNWINNEINL